MRGTDLSKEETMFRNNDLLADFERLTKGLNLGVDFDRAMNDIADSFTAPTKGSAGVDAVRLADRFELYIDLPGIDPNTVDLTVEGRTVTVSAERTFVVADDAEVVHRGRRHGSFQRNFRISDDLDLEQLSARSEHGVLVVTVPVAASAQARKVAIVTDTDSIETTATNEPTAE